MTRRFGALLLAAAGACGPAKTLDGGFEVADASTLLEDAGAPPDAGLPDAGPPRRECLAVVRALTLLANDGGAFVCPGTQDFSGRVTNAVNAGGLWRVGLSVCAGDGGCLPREVRIGADPSPVPPPGTDVRLRFVARADAGCQVSALVTSPDGTLWLAASNTALAFVPETPFSVGIHPEGPPYSCHVSSFLACGTGFVAKLSFTGRDGGSSTGRLPQGEAAPFDVVVDGGTQHLVGTNWSSMSFGGCDGTPGFNWVVTPAP